MKKKILVIDDSQTQLMSLKVSLSKSGYDVITAQDGAEGISAVYEHFPDLIIADIIMPEINGYQLCRLLKNDNVTKNIPLILLTSLNQKLDKFWGLRAGGDAYFVKDGNMETILKEIEKLLSNSSFKSQEEKERFIKRKKSEMSDPKTRINQLLDQSLIESTIANEFRNLSEHILDTNTFVKGIFSLISSILDYEVLGVFLNDRDEKKERRLYLSVNSVDINKDVLEKIKESFFSQIFREGYNSDKNLFSFDVIDKLVDETNSINDIKEFRSRIIFPITHAGKILGGICIYSIRINKLNSSKVFHIMLEELKILMRMKWLYSETKFLTTTDSLTNLYNRRYFQQALEREYARARRYNDVLSIAMFDIDHFKNLNDNYGHQFGDKVLMETAQIIKSSLRKTDYVARYGGEEFVAILPSTNLERAVIPIERLRKSIEEKDFKFGDKSVKVTISVGVASLMAEINNEQEIVSRADQALYEAKQKGRNRVELYQG